MAKKNPRANLYKAKSKKMPPSFRVGFLAKLDNRSVAVRRMQRSLTRIVDDLGGADTLSALQLALCERFCFLEHMCREWEAEIVAGTLKADAYGRWVQACNTLNGLARHLGIKRVTDVADVGSLYRQETQQ